MLPGMLAIGVIAWVVTGITLDQPIGLMLRLIPLYVVLSVMPWPALRWLSHRREA